MPTFTLITNAEVYAPEFRGKNDILICNENIAAIDSSINIKAISDFDLDVVDAMGLKVFPGLIDAHVHIAGAGGEGGPSTRTPELQLSQLIVGGITTVVGCLGTDGITRNPEAVLMKAKSLRAEGVSAWMYTGSYQVPTPTITGSIARDLALIDEVIGAGEIALSDHRSSWPTTAELIRLAEEARVGGMLGGKAGIVNIHMGDANNPFQPIHEAVSQSELSYRQFLPTHCNRNDYIFEDAKKYGKEGYIDLTASSYLYFPEYEVKPSKALVELVAAGVPLEHITMTSDANGSLPLFDESGDLVRLEMGQPKSIFNEMVDAHRNEGFPLDKAIAVVTSNIARILKLKNKGVIRQGGDADLIFVNNDFEIVHIIARGKFLLRDGIARARGTYE